jgi:hypothetical protein
MKKTMFSVYEIVYSPQFTGMIYHPIGDAQGQLTQRLLQGWKNLRVDDDWIICWSTVTSHHRKVCSQFCPPETHMDENPRAMHKNGRPSTHRSF